MKTIMQISTFWAGWGKAWSRFWFSSRSPSQIRAFRTVFGFILFGYFATRSLDLDLFYTDKGILPLSVLPAIIGTNKGVYSLLTYFTSSTVLWVFHLSFLISLLTLAFGIFPRLSAMIASVLHLTFLHRNMAVAYGVDAISTYFLIYLCLADGSSKGPAESMRSFLSSIAFRFAQIQVCIIYGYSGLMKLEGPRWWRGEAVWDVLINHQLARWDFAWVGAFPLLITLCTYTTIIWEVYFPVLIWVKPLRRITLLAGVMLHLGIGIALNIPYFAAVMISTYLLFLDSGEIDSLVHFFTHLVRKMSRPLLKKIKVNRPTADESIV